MLKKDAFPSLVQFKPGFPTACCASVDDMLLHDTLDEVCRSCVRGGSQNRSLRVARREVHDIDQKY